MSGAALPRNPVGSRLNGGIEKRRAGKYHHPFGGMRQFAEDRAGRSGWDIMCLGFDNLEQRKKERSKLADNISEVYKEEFVRVNKAQGKGRPKANNISAAKKTVRMIAERILLSLEARATQDLMTQAKDRQQRSEKELLRLRHIHNCGRENPKLSYDEIRSIARSRLRSLGDDFDGDDPDGGSGPPSGLPGPSIAGPSTDTGEPDMEVEMMKQAIVEMRADEVSKGFTPKLLDERWFDKITKACRKLLDESYSPQFVPKTKVYGCKHFTRKNRILMVCCGTFPVCRMCHIQDLNRIHDVRIEPVQTMLCMMCKEVQPKAQYCRKCNVCFGSYYCDVCGITDDTPGYDLRHCDKCNVCMPGLTFHCDRCQSCVPATPEHQAVCTGPGGGGNRFGGESNQIQGNQGNHVNAMNHVSQGNHVNAMNHVSQGNHVNAMNHVGPIHHVNTVNHVNAVNHLNPVNHVNAVNHVNVVDHVNVGVNHVNGIDHVQGASHGELSSTDVNNITGPGESIDQSIDALTQSARNGQLFSGL